MQYGAAQPAWMDAVKAVLLLASAIAVALTHRWWRWAGWLAGRGLAQFVIRVLVIVLSVAAGFYIFRL